MFDFWGSSGYSELVLENELEVRKVRTSAELSELLVHCSVHMDLRFGKFGLWSAEVWDVGSVFRPNAR